MTYNLDGSAATRTDQRETVLTFTYDGPRRLQLQGATTLGDNVDDHIRSIKREYDVLGRIEKITSYSAADGTGTVRNQVQYEYDDLSRTKKIYQSHENVVVTASTPKTQMTYDDSVDGNNVFSDGGRLNYYTYPDGSTTIDYNPGDGGDVNDLLNRVVYVNRSGYTKMRYYYAGVGRIVIADQLDPDLRLDYRTAGSPTIYSGYDRFGRVRDQRWDDYEPEPDEIAVRIGHGYDYASNRVYREDVKAAASSVDIDEYYTYDGLDRLVNLDRGNLNQGKTAIDTSPPAREEDWTLDALGNWNTFVQKTSGTTNLNQARTHNAANEITQIDSSDTHVGEDAAGNMTKVPTLPSWSFHYSTTYDAWNRLVRIEDPNLVDLDDRIEYDGLNQRIVKGQYDHYGDLEETRHYYYNDRWQCVEERASTASPPPNPDTMTPTCQYIWGTRYIDELIFRDRDTDANGSLDERLYAMQDANWNVVAIAEPDGDVVERYLYDAYGKVTYLTPAFAPRQYQYSPYYWTHLYTGRQLDYKSGLMDYRNRYYHTGLGRFVSRDPIGYDGGMNLYEYVGGSPAILVDPSGLDAKDGTCPQPWKARSILGVSWQYGCYCGLEPVPPRKGIPDPIDPVDKCCKEHDECYGRAYNMVCGPETDRVYRLVLCDSELCSCVERAEDSKQCTTDACRKAVDMIKSTFHCKKRLQTGAKDEKKAEKSATRGSPADWAFGAVP